MPIQPPTIRFRQGNPNTLALLVSQAGVPLTPATGTTITAQYRVYDSGRVIGTAPLSAAPDGQLFGPVPALSPGFYTLGLLVDKPGTAQDFVTGVCRVQILPVGSLDALSDVTGLNVTITPENYLVNVTADAGPYAAICAYQAGIARDSAEQATAGVAEATTQAGIATTQAGIATTAAATAQSLVGNVLALVGQDAQTVTLAIGGSITYTDHPEAAYPYLSLTLL